jgi:RNA polymerase sigma-B factor
VYRLCKRYSHTGEPLEDLVQVGSLGLLKAIDKFDPQRGTPFLAFAIPVILGEIKNYFRDHGWAVKLPRKLQQHKRAVGHAVDSLTQSLGRSPSVPEICQATGLSPDQVYQTMELEALGKPLSLDAQYEQEDSEDSATILDFLGQQDPDLEALADRLDLQGALDRMDPTERAVLLWKFYSDLSQTNIAQHLGISQMQVSRLQRRALVKLKKKLVE